MWDLDVAYHIFNIINATCYSVIFFIIFIGLLKTKAFGRNLLGTMTAIVFLSYAIDKTSHLFIEHIHTNLLVENIQILVDGITLIPAIGYLILWRRYGLIIRGADLITEAQNRLKERELEVNTMRELERLKDEFLAVASHELRTPFTVVKSYTQLLISRFNNKLEPETLKILQIINNQVNRMNGLIMRLLDFNRIQANRFELKLEPFNLVPLVKETVERLQVAVPNYRLELKYEAEQIPVLVDWVRLEQVIENLVTNAIKYSPEVHEIEIICRLEGDRACVLVKDYGIGIAEKDLPNLFERYYRTDTVREGNYYGLGLGLYISHEVVKACKGEIKVDSTLGKGSTFSVLLPLSG
jgi:signal transduction histidine kinase